jgi:RHS repeat-associated protein
VLREGGVRGEVEELGTDYTYTGQREESALGLMYYVARWYDPHIAHFVQADTIVPGAGNPAAWNRYAYVMYNPLKYTDPSGHRNEGVWCMNHPDDPGCQGNGKAGGGTGGSNDPITTFQFDPVLLQGGPGAVPINYSTQIEEDYDDVGLIGVSYVSPNGLIYQLEDTDVVQADPAYWRIMYGVHPWTDAPGLLNQALVWLRDNTKILKYTSGGYHLTGGGVVFDSATYGYEGYPLAFATLSIENHTRSSVMVNNLVISRNGTNAFQDFGNLDYCSLYSVIYPSSSWDYSIPIFAPGDYEVFIYLSSFDQYGMTSGDFFIP